MCQMIELVVNDAVVNQQSTNLQNDNSDNNDLYEGHGGHVSESGSIKNEGSEQNINTSTSILPSSTPLSISSNYSNSTIKFNINGSIETKTERFFVHFLFLIERMSKRLMTIE